MTQIEKQIEQYHTMVGIDVTNKFESDVTTAICELAESLNQNYLEKDTKLSYATHVFAYLLDMFGDILDQKALFN